MKRLGLHEGFPEDLEAVCPKIICEDVLGKTVGVWNVHIIKGVKGRKRHRIMLECLCGKLVPFGRINQHKCRRFI
jgi:hypothetical protein